ncbi:hypothetical protein IEQ11_21020 [Lysobacter capsici]|uniref:hypothetical protein n=1 Tax=Lysobacter capsici TaxID=435897 RepID=UPI00177B407B|nr:hypothetical protein [Lysobacter capsici]UOF14182.1 hypothetical protein IEQ11_21020 [Lysobacter capsici]
MTDPSERNPADSRSFALRGEGPARDFSEDVVDAMRAAARAGENVAAIVARAYAVEPDLRDSKIWLMRYFRLSFGLAIHTVMRRVDGGPISDDQLGEILLAKIREAMEHIPVD